MQIPKRTVISTTLGMQAVAQLGADFRGYISGGTFPGVHFRGYISGGTFPGVHFRGYISVFRGFTGGTFPGVHFRGFPGVHFRGYISGGTFPGVHFRGYISGGTFPGYGVHIRGTFPGYVSGGTGVSGGSHSGGTFRGLIPGVRFRGYISGGTFPGVLSGGSFGGKETGRQPDFSEEICRCHDFIEKDIWGSYVCIHLFVYTLEQGELPLPYYLCSHRYSSHCIVNYNVKCSEHRHYTYIQQLKRKLSYTSNGLSAYCYCLSILQMNQQSQS